ncbi:hypothetical protein LF41_1205 [Lysobacter dokdonensis DS-58]|uniref:Uncharacterized protein n=1 Tax=Lysobacter dokdonensis DS-58 TaxID=1300345 RepID=A0A0A2WKI8_9GAMM|nr:hypothetical protein [Lysobacter dokdonensis]KGQ20666.1 hypothetical protein LF41_1205 [Lysobacter dokdonensis DS-58]
MIIRNSLLLLALGAVAGTAFAASPQSMATPAPAAKSTAAKAEHKDKRTCEQRGKTGHCEKWSKADNTKAAAKNK